ncbi:MAG TPA: caspase family protein [Bradyrhizobium sp.]|nr:caspase family protein [Bradyrhizobium sp.]
MKIRLAILLALIFAVASTVPSSAAGDRYALVIGNAKYPDADVPLKEPVNDARDVTDELKRDGFKVEIGENLTGEAMRRAFERLYGKIKPGDVVLLFFSGYGIQSNRQTYMMPVDCQLWQETDVRRDGISLENVLTEINNRGAGVKIALLDASRRNPYERRFRSFSAGLAPVVAPNGTLVMYSAALSSVISDNGGDHSLFVQELLKEIRVPDLMAEETLNKTRVGVTRASRQEQIPWISSSLSEDFSFVPGAGGASSPRPPTPIIEPLPPAKPTAAAPGPTPQANLAPAQPPKAEAPVIPPAPPAPPAPPPAAAENKPAQPPQPPAPPQPSASSQPAAPTQVALADDPTIKSLTAKIDANPDDFNALYRRGQVYASKGAYSLAVKDFDDTIRLHPKDVEALNNRCWARAVMGDLQSALRDCNEALRLKPDFVDALDSRGLVNLKAGQNKNAITDFDAALKLNSRLTSSLYGRGLAKQRNGSISEGNLDIANAKAMDPNIVQEFESYGVH